MTDGGDPSGGPRPIKRSRRMLWLSLVLAVVACLPFALVFTQSGSRAPEPLVLTDADQKSLTDGLRMISPSFSGRTEDGEPYTVTADWALPNGPKPTRITLNGIRATIKTKDGRDAVMTAERGVFFPRRDWLRLTEGVVARTSDGYTMEMPVAEVDIAGRMMEAKESIRAEGPRGSIRADTLEAVDSGGRSVIFRGNVRVVFTPETVSPPTKD